MTVPTGASGPNLAFVPTGLWPQVNVMPPEVGAGRRLKRTKKLLAFVVTGVLALCALGYAGSLFLASAAATDLENVQQDTARLTAEQAKYAEVPQVLGAITKVETARRLGTATEIAWTPYLNAIRAVTPASVSLDSLAVSAADPLLQQPASTNVLAASSLGAITFTARSKTVINTSDWLDALDAVPGLADAWFSAETLTEENGVSYFQVNATVQINSTALANRFPAKEGK